MLKAAASAKSRPWCCYVVDVSVAASVGVATLCVWMLCVRVYSDVLVAVAIGVVVPGSPVAGGSDGDYEPARVLCST
jgi:hypothetical protein